MSESAEVADVVDLPSGAALWASSTSSAQMMSARSLEKGCATPDGPWV